ncbi:glutamate 5-kinase [Alicyclobacillaceae bacterium I2511]|nr:glutamate 5-kinase [Alicyclobacillaceae bacterium I2511]
MELKELKEKPVRRVVVKVGSSTLTSPDGSLNRDNMARLVGQIAHIIDTAGCQMILVSSGAVAAGMGRLGWQRASITVPEKQAAAAVGQGLLVDAYERLFTERGRTIAQLLLTRSDVANRRRFIHIRNTLETLLRHGIVPVINENDTVAVDEIRFGDNDTLAALVALSADADLLMLLTDIDGLYTGNPRIHKAATKVADVYEITAELEALAGEAGSNLGTGGMRTKLQAARMAVSAGIQVVIASLEDDQALAKAVAGESVGTVFHAAANALPRKKLWIAHGSRVQGQIVIDSGAIAAVQDGTGSLLVPGVTRVEGNFGEGAVVEFMDEQGTLVGKGVVSLSAADLRMVLQQKAAGPRLNPLPALIHRNEMVVWKAGRLV